MAEANNLTVRIADDGIGFDPALVSPKLDSGAGLLGMRERASIARARLAVESDSAQVQSSRSRFPLMPSRTWDSCARMMSQGGRQ